MSAPSRCEFGAPTARAAPGEGRRVLREARRVNGPSVAESLCTRAFRGTDRLTMNCSRAEVKRFSATIGPFQRLTFRQYRVSHRSVISNEAPQLRETPITQITQLPSAAHPRRATGLDRAFAWGFAGCSLLMCGNRACGFAVFIIWPSGASAHKIPGLTFRFSSSAFRRSRMRFHERLERSRCRAKAWRHLLSVQAGSMHGSLCPILCLPRNPTEYDGVLRQRRQALYSAALVVLGRNSQRRV